MKGVRFPYEALVWVKPDRVNHVTSSLNGVPKGRAVRNRGNALDMVHIPQCSKAGELVSKTDWQGSIPWGYAISTH